MYSCVSLCLNLSIDAIKLAFNDPDTNIVKLKHKSRGEYKNLYISTHGAKKWLKENAYMLDSTDTHKKYDKATISLIHKEIIYE